MIRSFFRITYAFLFRNGRFYCKLKAGRKLTFKIWEAPGKWCQKKELTTILADLHEIVKEQNLREVPPYGVLEGKKEDLDKRIITIAYNSRTGEPVAFSAQKFLNLKFKNPEVQVLHLGLSWVKKSKRTRSLVSYINIIPMLLVLVKYGFRPIWISNVSQVPAIIGNIAFMLKNVFPDPYGRGEQSAIHRTLATAIMKEHRSSFGVAPEAGFDLKSQIITNAYTGGSDAIKKSFEKTTHYRDAIVNDFCREKLDYHRGDDFLQLALLEKTLIKRYLSYKSGSMEPGYARMARGVYFFFRLLSPLFRIITHRQHKFDYRKIN